MKRLTTQLMALAEVDAAGTDPNPEQVECGWARLSAAVAAPGFAVATSTTAATVSIKKVLGVIVVLAIGAGGVGAATGAFERTTVATPAIAAVDEAPATAPRDDVPAVPAVIEPPREQPAELVVPPVSDPVPKPKRRRVMSLAEQVRALGAARRHLDAGNNRKALRRARTLLRQPDVQVGPEAQAVEAIAACGLGLSAGPRLAKAFVSQHPSSPLRGRVARTCEAR